MSRTESSKHTVTPIDIGVTATLLEDSHCLKNIPSFEDSHQTGAHFFFTHEAKTNKAEAKYGVHNSLGLFDAVDQSYFYRAILSMQTFI